MARSCSHPSGTSVAGASGRRTWIGSARPKQRRSPPALTMPLSTRWARSAAIAQSTAYPLAMPPRSIQPLRRHCTRWSACKMRSRKVAPGGRLRAGVPRQKALLHQHARRGDVEHAVGQLAQRHGALQHAVRLRIDADRAARLGGVDAGDIAVFRVKAHQALHALDGRERRVERGLQQSRPGPDRDVDQGPEQRPGAAQLT